VRRNGVMECTIEPQERTRSDEGVGESGDERVLRAKYLDWCSARLADRFVRLTPEEIYALAERAEQEDARDASEATAAVEPLAFQSLVERVTAALTSELSLPTFEEWAQAYREDATRFDDELSGLWRDSS